MRSPSSIKPRAIPTLDSASGKIRGNPHEPHKDYLKAAIQFLGSAPPGAFPIPIKPRAITPACPAFGRIRGNPARAPQRLLKASYRYWVFPKSNNSSANTTCNIPAKQRLRHNPRAHKKYFNIHQFRFNRCSSNLVKFYTNSYYNRFDNLHNSDDIEDRHPTGF